MSSSSKKGKRARKTGGAAGRRAEAAPLSRRIIAFLIDWYVGALATSLPIAIIAVQSGLEMTNQDIASYPEPLGFAAGVAGFVAGLAYYALVPMVWGGRTLGKRAMGLRIVDADGDRARVTSLLLRQVVGLILIENALLGTGTVLRQMVSMAAGPFASTVVLWIGFIGALAAGVMIIVRRDRRGLHDLIAGTKVVSV